MATPLTARRHPGAAAPVWAQYAFAVAISLAAWVLEVWLNRIFDAPITPFLPGFAAVIASAAWAGFGPGVVSTVLVALWSVLFVREQHHGPAGDIFRCLLFVAEGVLLSIGSGRLRQATRIVAESEDWHRRLLQTASEGILVTDDSGVITYSNPRMAEILAITTDELPGRCMEEFFFPSDFSIEKVRTQNLRAGTKEQFDRRLRRRDGNEVWVLTCANPLHDQKDRYLGVLSMMTDITERKKAENALRHSEQRYRGLFDNVLEGIYQSTPDGRILAANPMLLRMLGLTQQSELNDVNIANDLYVDANVRRKLLERLEQDGSFQNVEYELRRRNGQVITVQENARAVRDEEGRVLYYEGTLTDVSEKKRTDAQLRHAQKMDALGSLAGGIAHDFSNVLTVISGYARLVLEELPGSHGGRSNAKLLVSATESAAALTRQLLSFSSHQTNSQVVTDLNLVIREAEHEILGFLNGRMPSRRVELSTSLCAEPLTVQADPGHMRQALISLAANVRDTMEGEHTLRLATRRTSLLPSFCSRHPGLSPGAYAEIYVSSGTAAFEGTGKSSAQAGEGFGLATAQTIVTQYGGLMLTDRSAAGSFLFTVYLPLTESTAEPSPVVSEVVVQHDEQETILLVDDEPLVREISRDILERHGYRVLLAPGPGEAERLSLEGNSFDLLITDVVMPHVNGPELARRLRAKNPRLKVLFISGYAQQRIEESGIIPTDVLLQKPFSADSLERKIRQLLDPN